MATDLAGEMAGEMALTERTIPAPANRVFEILANGWSYAAWVVGNSHVRRVDPEWPAVGSQLHHSSGAWPLQVRDTTIVRAMEPDRLLDLQARLWVFGRLNIRFTLIPVSGGGPDGTDSTRVVMEEKAVGGPIQLIPHPMQRTLLKARNAEVLARLADLATGGEGKTSW